VGIRRTLPAGQRASAVNTDRWCYRVFQSAPDLIRGLLPGAAAASGGLGLDPSEPGDRLYRFEALEQKEVSHRHDGVLWPRAGTGVAETGSEAYPVVLLEVQMQPDPAFQARLAAQSLRFVQRHPKVEQLEVVVITPHRRLTLGPVRPPMLQMFVGEVHWISLEDLSREPDLDPLLNLLTLPIRPERELAATSQRILASRPDLDTVVLPMLIQRFPQLSEERIMVIAGIPREEIRHTRAVQEWLAEGRRQGQQEGLQEGLQEGRQEGEVTITLRLLNRRCGPLDAATTARVQALPLERLEALAESLLDFQRSEHLAAWLAANT